MPEGGRPSTEEVELPSSDVVEDDVERVGVEGGSSSRLARTGRLTALGEEKPNGVDSPPLSSSFSMSGGGDRGEGGFESSPVPSRMSETSAPSTSSTSLCADPAALEMDDPRDLEPRESSRSTSSGEGRGSGRVALVMTILRRSLRSEEHTSELQSQ